MRWRGRRAFALVMLLGLASCHAQISRLVAQGRYDEAIARAEAAKRPPRGEAARAWARALVARDRVEAAQAVLLRDFRRGAELESLLALADLERARGLTALAAHHYARVLTLRPKLLRDRTGACRLLAARVDMLLALGEAAAARAEARRVAEGCPDTPVPTPPPAGDTDVDGVAEPRGPDAIDDAWLAQRAPQQVVELLEAELTGRRGPWLLPDHTLRLLVGHARWADFVPVLDALSAGTRAFAELRLRRVVVDAPALAAPEAEHLSLHKASEAAGADAWRMYGWSGDLGAAELALAGTLRDAARTGSDDPPPSSGGRPAWAATVPLTPQTLERLLVLAKMRDAGGPPEEGLRLARTVLERAHARGLDASAAARGHARYELARGRPWRALAVLEAVPSADLDPLRSAAASAVLLTAALCDDQPCVFDADRVVTEAVMGTAFIEATRDRLPVWAFGARPETAPAASDLPCRGLDALIEPVEADPLVKAYTAMLTEPGRPQTGERLREALVAEPLLSCNGTSIVALMFAGGYGLTASALSELLVHNPDTLASSELVVEAELAMVGGHEDRAELLAIAAASASQDPAATWRRVVQMAKRTKMRSLARMGLRELILHAPKLAHEPARRALVVDALWDLERSWVVQETAIGADALAGHVEEYVRWHEPELRWAARERLAIEAAALPWATPRARQAALEAIFPEPLQREAHPRAVAMLAGTAASTPPDWDDVLLARAIRRGETEALPPSVAALADPSDFESSRLAVAAGTGSDADAIAVGLAVLGSPRARAQAVASLLARAKDVPARRRGLQRWILGRPLGAAASGTVPVFVDDGVRLAVFFGLDLESAFVAR